MATSTTPNDEERQRDHLDDVREMILDVVQLVEDTDQRAELLDWVDRSYATTAGSVEEHVDTRLARLKSENDMIVLSEGGSAEESFPDDCESCDHYGGACPIFHDKVAQDSLEMIADDAETDREYARRMRHLARDFRCHRIPEFVSEFYDGDGDLVVEGHELLAEVGMEAVDSESDEPQARVDAAEFADVDRAGGQNGGGR